MAARFSFTPFLFVSFAAASLASESSVIKAVPQNHRAAGVFMLPEGGEYTLNFTDARAACLFLNVTMATREQMERAVRHGLETCKFGWTAEQIAVIPRRSSDIKCGKGNTGVVTWSASTNTKFGVFCFDASVSDSEETLTTWTASRRSSTSSSSPTAAASPSVTSATESPPTTRSPEKTALTSASALPVQTSRSSRVSSSTSSSLPVSTRPPAAPSQRVVSLPCSTSVHTSSVSVSTAISAEAALGAAPTALVWLGVAVLLLAAAAVMWYHKLTVRRCWSKRRQEDDGETEMWKHSETDLHRAGGGAGGAGGGAGGAGGAGGDHDHGDSDRKYSSDITLCVNPDIKAHSVE